MGNTLPFFYYSIIMKIKLTSNIGIGGKHNVAGSVVDVSELLGRELVGRRRAILWTEEEEEAPRQKRAYKKREKKEEK